MNEPQETPEKPKSFDMGATIKAARLKKGLKQEDVGKHLRISVKQVSALEHNRREEFPAQVYYRGALQATCEFLDLDFNELWKQMHPPPADPTPASGPSTPTTSGSRPVDHSPSLENKRPPFRAPRKPINVPKLSGPLLIPVMIFGGLLFAAGIFWMVGRQEGSKPARVHDQPAPKPVETTPAPAPQPQTPKAGMHALRIESRDDAWLRLRVDRQLVFEGNLPKGKSQTWEGKKSFGVRCPRESSLSIWLDDVPLDVATLERDTYGNIVIQPSSANSRAAAQKAEKVEEKPAEIPVQTAPPLIP